MNKIQLINSGADYSALGLGQLLPAYNPYTDPDITILGAWDADDASTFTVNGANKVLTMPSKFGGFVLNPFNASYRADYLPAGWAGGVNPLSDSQANGAFSFTGGVGTTGTVYSGLGAAPPTEGTTTLVLAQRAAQLAHAAGVSVRPVVALGSYPYASGTPPQQYSYLGCMDATADPAQTAAVFGAHQATLASNANAAPWAVGAKAVLAGVASAGGHAIGLNGTDPTGAGSYFNIPPQQDANKWSIGGAWNVVDGGFTGLVKLVMVVSNVNLTAAKRRKLEGYMAWRGGIQASLPASHPYLSEGP